jgi:3-deoxy-manno-octulosonate cytidylyltransferase (CMP-KDO synthetase)
MDFSVLIPARLSSTRLPNKPLADLAGQAMVVRVAKRAALSRTRQVVVATDSAAIVQVCEAAGIRSVLTDTDHPSGSDRLAQASALLGLADHEVVVNVQGDEPLIDPELINAVAQLLHERPDCAMSTAAHAIEHWQDYQNPNVVKVVTDAQGTALYFSRSPIAHGRDFSAQPWWQQPGCDLPAPLRHVGIYAYRVGFLREFPKLSVAPIERLESLEQLRALWHGRRIAVHLARQAPGPGVDTQDDLDRVREILQRQL